MSTLASKYCYFVMNVAAYPQVPHTLQLNNCTSIFRCVPTCTG